MDALRRSIAEEKRSTAPAKKGRKRIVGQTEMLLPIPGKKAKEAGDPGPFSGYSGDGGQAFHLKADSDSGRSRTAFR